ncbi:hypothetical protein ACFWJY_05645, partial [Streptomyces anulatus]
MATLPNPLPSLATSGLDLPPGSLVDATLDGPWHEPLLWYADGPGPRGRRGWARGGRGPRGGGAGGGPGGRGRPGARA